MRTNTTNFIATIVLSYYFILVFTLVVCNDCSFGYQELLIPLKKTAVFFTPFLAILLFWACYSFILSSANDFTLAKRIANLLPLGGNPYLLILITGIIGGLAAGVAAIFGKQLRLVAEN